MQRKTNLIHWSNMKRKTHGSLNLLIGDNAKILVIVDAPPSRAYDLGEVMSNPAMKLFGKHMKALGFGEEDFAFITACPPIPEAAQPSEAKTGAWIDSHHASFLLAVEKLIPNMKAVVCMGKSGNRQHCGKATSIMKVRGTLCTRSATGDLPVVPTFGAAHVMTRPENEDTFESDLRLLGALRECGWSIDAYRSSGNTSGYQWCLDLQPVLDSKPKGIAVDCETVGLDWHKEGFRVLNVSVTTAQGNAYVVPLDVEYFNDPKVRGHNTPSQVLTIGQVEKLKGQLRTLLSDPEVSTVGHNLKYDVHCLRAIGIDVTNWYADTMQLAFAADDNMQSKSLTECTRRWVPALAGYSDLFDAYTDKANMQTVPHDEMLDYAGGDTDATYRLAKILLKEVKQDTKNWNTFLKVQMPTLRAFVEVEENGLHIDRVALRKLEKELTIREAALYRELLLDTPPKILRKYEVEGMSFSNPGLIREILFGNDGFRLKPLVFTKTTRKLPPAERVPSTSAKDHLPFFDEHPFVQKLMAYSKLTKMRGTYVGTEGLDVVTSIRRNANGTLPVHVNKHLFAAGIVLPKTTAFRSLTQLELFDDETGAPVVPPAEIQVKSNLTLAVDKFGNVTTTKKSSPSGFYHNLQHGDVLHASFALHNTVTGRTSSFSPNLQNIPKRGELAKEFRKIFVPPKGYILLEADLSQAEIRVAAWMANDKALIDIYKSGGDVHSATAASTMGITEKKFLLGRKCKTLLMDVMHDWPGAGSWLNTFGNNERKKLTVSDFCDFKRYQAKAINFGFLYGMRAAGFKRYAKTDYGIDMTIEEAEEIRAKFFEKYSGLAGWHKGIEKFVRANQYVRALHGALRRLPGINSDDDMIQISTILQAVNAPVQRFSSDLGLIALHRLVRDAPRDKIKPMVFIHDAIVVAVREDYVQEGASALKFYMESPPLEEWFGIAAPFPIVSDVSTGMNLGSMSEIEGIEAKQPDWYRSGEQATNPNQGEAWRKKKLRGIVMSDAPN